MSSTETDRLDKMVINIKAIGALDRENLCERITSFGAPAIVVDENFKIVCKTASVNEFLTGVRKGSEIKRYLSEESLFEIEKIENEHIFHCEMASSKRNFGVAVIGGSDCRLVIFRPIYNDIVASVERSYCKMSGYDGSIGEEIEDACNSLGRASIIADAINGFQTIRGLPFFDASAVLNRLFACLPDEIRDNVELSASDSKIVTNGNERDFALAFVFALANCLERGSHADISLFEQSGETVLRISSDFSLGKDGRINLSKFLKSKGEKFLWLYLLKLISDANLWDFGIFSLDSGDTTIEIRSSLFKNGDEFLLREDNFDFAPDLIKAFFG